jgi:outer membrane protein assembly factor BamB
MVLVGLAVAVGVRLLGWLDDPPAPLNDPAIRNIITLLALLAAGLAAWFWFCFGSHFPRRLRLGVPLGSGAALLVLVSVVATLRARRVLNFSGSLVPRVATPELTTPEFTSQPSRSELDFTSTTPDDFPQFLGPDRNGWIGHVELSRDWQSQPPELVWRRPMGAGWSAFAVTNDLAVTLEQRGPEEWVTCYAVATGEPLWGHSIAARHDTALGGIGPRSTPTIHDGKIFTLGATGVLQCLDSQGQVLWHKDLRKLYGVTAEQDEQHVMFGRAASPLIVDNLVVVPGGGPQGTAKNLIAFDQRSGQLAWEAENRLASGEADQIAYASPTLATLAGRRQIVIVNESTASGHDPATGQRLWSHAWPGRSNGNASVSQAVAVGSDRVLLTKGYGGGAELIELSDSDGDALEVRSVWKVARVLQTKFSNVVVHQGHAYGLSEGILECVALDNGRRRWKSGRYGHGQVLGVGDLLLVLAEEGELHLLELNPEKFTHLGSVRALNGKSWNNLCLVGKRLLLRNSAEAACYELP